MRVEEIYERYSTPSSVRERMLIATGFVMNLRDCWVGQTLDWGAIIKATILFDMGGIVRLDFEKEIDEKDSLENSVEYWMVEQKKIVDLYGDDARTASRKIIKKIGLDKYISTLVARGVFVNAEDVLESHDYHLKIFLYATIRTLGYNIVLLEEKLENIKSQYTEEEFVKNSRAVKMVEDVLSQNVYILLDDVSTEITREKRNELLNIDIKHYKNPSV